MTSEPVVGEAPNDDRPGRDEPASALDAAVGERVRIALWRSRKTQAELAEKLGVDQGSLSRRLRGRIAWKVTDVYKAADLLQVSVDELLSSQESNA